MEPNEYEIVSERYKWIRATSEIYDVGDGTRRPDTDYLAKVDVYEDRVRSWFLNVAQQHTRRGSCPADYVALAIALSYVEGVEQYRTGNGTRGQSKDRFKASVRRIFQGVDDDLAKRLYEVVRCGLFHSGFTEGPTLVSYDRPHAIELANGYVYLNPGELVSAVIGDFAAYVAELRAEPNGVIASNFVKLWDERWLRTEEARSA